MEWGGSQAEGPVASLILLPRAPLVQTLANSRGEVQSWAMRHFSFLGLMVLALATLLGCSAQRATPSGLSLRPGESLEEAIARAPEGAIIVLSPGKYQANLRLEKSVTIRGAGPETTVIQAFSPGPPVVWVLGKAKVRLENLRIEGGRGGFTSLELSSAGILVQDEAQIELQTVKIAQNMASGIFARDQARLSLRDVEILENSRYGLEIYGQVQVFAERAWVYGNKMGGVWAAGEGRLELEGSRVEKNLGPGFWIRESAKVRLWEAELRENQGPGLSLRDSGEAQVSASLVFGHGEAGALLSDEAVLYAYGTIFEANWKGLEIRGGKAFLEGCTILRNRWDGVVVRGKAEIRVERSRFLEGVGSGISASGWARVEVLNSFFEGFTVAGIFGFSNVPVHGEGNEFERNGVPLLGNVEEGVRKPKVASSREFLEFPDPAFSDLQEAVDALLPGGVLTLLPGRYPAGIVVDKPLEIQGNGEAVFVGSKNAPALALVGGAKLRLSGVHVTGGSEGLAMGADSVAELIQCAFRENELGIILWHNAHLYAFQTVISQHPQGGIWLWDESQAILEEVTLLQNELCGICAGGQSSLVLRKSTVSENRGHGGLLLRDFAEVEVWESVFSRNSGYGVSVQHPSCGCPGPGFFGKVSGGGNEFAENYKGPTCPADLIFLAR